MKTFKRLFLSVAFCGLAAPALQAQSQNPCARIPESQRPAPGWPADAAVKREWELMRRTLGEIAELHSGPHADEEDSQLKFDLNALPGAGPIAFKGRTGVETELYLYFLRGRLACVVAQSKSRPAGSLWDRAFLLVPVETELRPALEYRGPGKSPFQAFERLDLKEQLGFLRQLHRNLRATRSYLERRRAAEAGRERRKNSWSFSP